MTVCPTDQISPEQIISLCNLAIDGLADKELVEFKFKLMAIIEKARPGGCFDLVTFAKSISRDVKQLHLRHLPLQSGTANTLSRINAINNRIHPANQEIADVIREGGSIINLAAAAFHRVDAITDALGFTSEFHPQSSGARAFENHVCTRARDMENTYGISRDETSQVVHSLTELVGRRIGHINCNN